ncbi:MAG: hypothetical protein PH343_07550 [Nitrospira sp.]|nr:hypothetical protein [Nitrospira sp.]
MRALDKKIVHLPGRRSPDTFHGTLTGRYEVETIAMEIAASFLKRGEKVFWVDGGNSFNPYMLTEAAKRLNINPQPLLRRLFVARAFTVHQLMAMIIRHLGPALDKHPDALGVIYDPLALCSNPDVPKTEAKRAMKQIAVEVERIKAKGHRLIIAMPEAKHPMIPLNYSLPFKGRVRVGMGLFSGEI